MGFCVDARAGLCEVYLTWVVGWYAVVVSRNCLEDDGFVGRWFLGTRPTIVHPNGVLMAAAVLSLFMSSVSWTWAGTQSRPIRSIVFQVGSFDGKFLATSTNSGMALTSSGDGISFIAGGSACSTVVDSSDSAGEPSIGCTWMPSISLQDEAGDVPCTVTVESVDVIV